MKVRKKYKCSILICTFLSYYYSIFYNLNEKLNSGFGPKGRSIVTIFFLKINNNTSSLETFEDQNDYLLG